MEERGFSFIEILVALLLTTSISLALLKQQWQIHRWRIQIQHQARIWLQESNQREQGLSILECMLGLTLALSLLTLLMQQYLQIKQQTYSMAQTMLQASRLQMVVDLLRGSGHQAGFTPCLPIGYLYSFDHRSRRRLQAVELSRQDPFTLTYYRMSSGFVSLSPSLGQHEFFLLNKLRPHPKQPVIIADCQHAEVLDAYQIGPHSIQFSQALHYTYHPPIYLGEWLKESFYIAVNHNGQNSLFYQQNQHVDELMSDLQGISGYLEISQQKRWLHLNLDLGHGNAVPLLIRMVHA